MLTIQQAKDSNSLPAWVEALTGKRISNQKIVCPFHNDAAPSLHVYPDGRWRCYGCDRNGDVLDFVGYFLKGTAYNPHIHIREVIDHIGGLGIKPGPPTPSVTTKDVSRPSLDPVLADMYHAGMTDNAREFWYNRGVTDDSIDRFNLGYTGRRHSIPTYYRDVLLGIKLRRDDTKEPGGSKYLQAKGSRVTLFNSDVLRGTTDYIIVTEGEIDAILLYQEGFLAVSGTGGAAAFRTEWCKYFSHVRDIFVVYDNDDAGAEGALKVRSVIRRAQIIRLPTKFKDIGEMSTDMTPLGELLLQATRDVEQKFHTFR